MPTITPAKSMGFKSPFEVKLVKLLAQHEKTTITIGRRVVYFVGGMECDFSTQSCFYSLVLALLINKKDAVVFHPFLLGKRYGRKRLYPLHTANLIKIKLDKSGDLLPNHS